MDLPKITKGKDLSGEIAYFSHRIHSFLRNHLPNAKFEYSPLFCIDEWVHSEIIYAKQIKIKRMGKINNISEKSLFLFFIDDETIEIVLYKLKEHMPRKLSERSRIKKIMFYPLGDSPPFIVNGFVFKNIFFRTVEGVLFSDNFDCRGIVLDMKFTLLY